MKHMIKLLVIACLMAALTGASILAVPTGAKEVEEGIAKAGNLKKLKQYREAVDILNKLLEKYPAEDYDIGRELAILYGKTEEFDKGLEIWENGHKKGYYYFIIPNSDDYSSYVKQKKFKEIFKRDHIIRKEVNDKTPVSYETVLPKTYSKSRTYPVFLILHGGGSTIARAKANWKSHILDDEYIQVFLQSYIHYDMHTYGWKSSDPRTREEIKRCYAEIVENYSVDQSRVVIGGISAGATMAIDIAFTGIIPITGFIAVCPGKPTEFKTEGIEAAVKAGKKGILIAGETDFYRPRQEEMINAFNKLGFKYLYTVIPGLGHDYPADFPAKIDIALRRLF